MSFPEHSDVGLGRAMPPVKPMMQSQGEGGQIPSNVRNFVLTPGTAPSIQVSVNDVLVFTPPAGGALIGNVMVPSGLTPAPSPAPSFALYAASPGTYTVKLNWIDASGSAQMSIFSINVFGLATPVPGPTSIHTPIRVLAPSSPTDVPNGIIPAPVGTYWAAVSGPDLMVLMMQTWPGKPWVAPQGGQINGSILLGRNTPQSLSFTNGPYAWPGLSNVKFVGLYTLPYNILFQMTPFQGRVVLRFAILPPQGGAGPVGQPPTQDLAQWSYFISTPLPIHGGPILPRPIGPITPRSGVPMKGNLAGTDSTDVGLGRAMPPVKPMMQSQGDGHPGARPADFSLLGSVPGLGQVPAALAGWNYVDTNYPFFVYNWNAQKWIDIRTLHGGGGGGGGQQQGGGQGGAQQSFTIAPGAQTIQVAAGSSFLLNLPTGATWTSLVLNYGQSSQVSANVNGSQPVQITVNGAGSQTANATYVDSSGATQTATITIQSS